MIQIAHKACVGLRRVGKSCNRTGFSWVHVRVASSIAKIVGRDTGTLKRDTLWAGEIGERVEDSHDLM